MAAPETLWAAWSRVAAGSGMPGADGVSVAEFARGLGPRLRLLSELLNDGGYRAQPLRSVTAVRGGRTRARGVPTVADRVAQRAVLQVCGDRLQAAESATSFAYQKGRSWLDALATARDYGEQGLRWVFRTDIADYFASVDHRQLMTTLVAKVEDQRVVDLLRQWVSAPVLSATGLRAVARGLPEGAPVSPALANLYLREFDSAVDGRHGRLVRYADDIALFCPDLDAAVAGAEQIIHVLAELGLEPNRDKTYFSTFDAGFRLLGWEFSRETGRAGQPLPAGPASSSGRGQW